MKDVEVREVKQRAQAVLEPSPPDPVVASFLNGVANDVLRLVSQLEVARAALQQIYGLPGGQEQEPRAYKIAQEALETSEKLGI